MSKGINPFVVFADVKKSVSMLQVLERYGLTGQMRPRRDSWIGPCPIHKGKNPTQFHLSVSKNCWYCFGPCQGGGNVLDFVARMEDVSVRDAALLIVEWFGLTTPAEPAPRPEPVPAAPPPDDPIPGDEVSTEGLEILENPALPFGLKSLDPSCLDEEGFDRATVAHFGAGLCAKGIMRGRVAIPIHNLRGELVAYAGRRTGEEGELYKYPPKFHRDLEVYNLHRAEEEARGAEEGLILVPDFLDVFRLHEAGFKNAAALMGETLSAAQERALQSVEIDRITVLGAETSRLYEVAGQLSRNCYVRTVGLDRAPADVASDSLARVIQAVAPPVSF